MIGCQHWAAQAPPIKSTVLPTFVSNHLPPMADHWVTKIQQRRRPQLIYWANNGPPFKGYLGNLLRLFVYSVLRHGEENNLDLDFLNFWNKNQLKTARISERFQLIADQNSKEFSRKPRSLTEIARWEAIELSNFFLYSTILKLI